MSMRSGRRCSTRWPASRRLPWATRCSRWWSDWTPTTACGSSTAPTPTARSDPGSPAPHPELAWTMTESAPLPLSVLELATVGSGQSSAEALAATTRVAEAADRLGYSRFWVAEHHNMPAVASTSPPVLIAHLAANTRRIKLGSGGVMLPTHMPFVVAEQFALLEALYPHRIDLGIGRAPGTDQATAAALRGVSPYLTVEQFPEHLQTVLALLGDDRVAPAGVERLSATPQPRTFPEIWILGSSTYGAQVAAALGLPF